MSKPKLPVDRALELRSWTASCLTSAAMALFAAVVFGNWVALTVSIAIALGVCVMRRLYSSNIPFDQAYALATTREKRYALVDHLVKHHREIPDAGDQLHLLAHFGLHFDDCAHLLDHHRVCNCGLAHAQAGAKLVLPSPHLDAADLLGTRIA